MRLPRILHLTLPATNSVVLRLPRNLCLTLRKCCACRKTCARPCESIAPATHIQSLGKLDLAKVPRRPRTLHLTLRKCCACHASQPLRNLRVAVPMGPRSEPAPNTLRTRSERAPNALRPGAANSLASSSPETPTHARGHAFCRFLTPTTRSHAYVSARAGFQLVAVTRKFLLNFL